MRRDWYKLIAHFVMYASLLGFALTMMILMSGCVRRPGQSYPFVSQSYAEDDIVYHGVGVRF
jgi:hypothetical protein